MKKALVTGGAGFIGSHIVEKLLMQGYSAVVLDDFSSGKHENLSFTEQYARQGRFTLLEGNICDYEMCLRATEGVDVIFHQAALRSVPKSLDNPYIYNKVNIDGILNMLNAAKERNIKRFVFASSSSVYGDTDQFPEKESAYPLLISPYALTKLTGEFYCRIFSENYGLETVSLRYFNVYGPRQALDDEYAVVIPKFITCMLHDQQPPIHGTGEQSRDFCYIDNVVEANLAAANCSGITNEVINVACGQDHSILELVAGINTILGKSIKPVFTPPRQGDVFKTLADMSKAEQIMGFVSKIDFDEGLRRTVEYFKSQR